MKRKISWKSGQVRKSAAMGFLYIVVDDRDRHGDFIPMFFTLKGRKEDAPEEWETRYLQFASSSVSSEANSYKETDPVIAEPEVWSRIEDYLQDTV